MVAPDYRGGMDWHILLLQLVESDIRPPEQADGETAGELFAVRGHFYHVRKIAGAPAVLPKTLHWFKYEAYFTWVTGVSLAVVYYLNAKVYLIDASIMALTPLQAIGISLGFLVGGWVVWANSVSRPSPSHRLLLQPSDLP